MRVLGVDLGQRRIGLAISDPSRTLARPLRTLTVGPGEALRALAGEVDRLASGDDGLAAVVVGWPRWLDGRAHAQTERVQTLVDALRRRVAMPVVLQDERLTSHEAEQRVARRERDWRRRKPLVDAAAAAIILQDYLDQRATPLEGPVAGRTETP